MIIHIFYQIEIPYFSSNEPIERAGGAEGQHFHKFQQLQGQQLQNLRRHQQHDRHKSPKNQKVLLRQPEAKNSWKNCLWWSLIHEYLSQKQQDHTITPINTHPQQQGGEGEPEGAIESGDPDKVKNKQNNEGKGTKVHKK